MTGATLFSGIGAPECARPDVDWQFCAEIEPFPAAVHVAHFPHVPNLGDVTAPDFIERAKARLNGSTLDVLIFGSPCQSFSVAGKRLGLDDPRGNLALHALRICREIAPTWFVFENVPGLFSSWSGAPQDHGDMDVERKKWGRAVREFIESSDFAGFLCGVQDIGYCGAWSVLDSQYFGVAQRRERVFFVGNSGDWRRAAAVLLEPESLCGNTPPSREAPEDIAPTISARTNGGGGLGTDFDCDGGLIAFGGNNTAGPIDVATACRAKGGSGHGDFESETFVTHALRADGFDASEDGTGCGTPLVAYAYTIHGTDKTQKVASETDIAGCLRTRAPGSQENSSTTVVAFSCKNHGADASELAPTLRSMGYDGSHANGGGQVAVAFNLRGRDGGAQPEVDPDGLASIRAASGGSSRSYVAGMAVRRLTPRECERLQAFPDGWTAITYRKILKSGKVSKRLYRATDGPRYKAIGNSMTVNVLRWILDRIESVQLVKQKTQEAGEIKAAAIGPAAVTVALESTGTCEPTSEYSTEALSENAPEAK